MSAQDILVLGETHLGALSDITLELLGGARQLATSTGGKVVAVIFGPDGARHAAALQGADRVLAVDDPQLAAYTQDSYLAVLEAVIRAESPRAVLLGCTSIGLDVGPGLGARLDVPVVVGCRQIEAENGSLKVTASFFGGKMLADVELDKTPAILLVLPGSFRPSAEARGPEVQTGPSPVPLEPGPIRFEQMILPPAGDVDITKESVLVCVGRGIQQQENMEIAEQLAKALGGQLCATRPVVDQGWLPTTRQVGKSGMTVHPKCYFALGVSGAPEHTEGIKGSELIIAVNTDPKAPIFETAHYGVVGDLMDLVPAITQAIQGKHS
ncbi:MAG: electron transfer flavoprotein subunit alpha/FixB family protein [Thermoguttaceae bacterium]